MKHDNEEPTFTGEDVEDFRGVGMTALEYIDSHRFYDQDPGWSGATLRVRAAPAAERETP